MKSAKREALSVGLERLVGAGNAKRAVLQAAFGIKALPEPELFAELERLYWQGAAALAAKVLPLYDATNEMVAVLGAHGEICARDDRVMAVMDALHAIDGGTPARPDTDVCRHGIHRMNACGACVPARGSTVNPFGG